MAVISPLVCGVLNDSFANSKCLEKLGLDCSVRVELINYAYETDSEEVSGLRFSAARNSAIQQLLLSGGLCSTSVVAFISNALHADWPRLAAHISELAEHGEFTTTLSPLGRNPPEFFVVHGSALALLREVKGDIAKLACLIPLKIVDTVSVGVSRYREWMLDPLMYRHTIDLPELRRNLINESLVDAS